jgi:RHS repeat-associated protein
VRAGFPDAGGGIGGLIAILSPGAGLLSPVYDGKGNVSAVLDVAQAPVAAYGYDEFGVPVATAGELEQPFRFSTKPYDPQTGLADFGYQFYSPALGRWLSRDPLGEFAAPLHNLYRFVGNNPLNAVDPNGLKVTVYARMLNKTLGGVGVHTFIEIQPDNPADFNGQRRWTIGGYNNELTDNLDARISDSTDMAWKKPFKGMYIVPLPEGKTDTQFINDIMAAFGRYPTGSRTYEPFPNVKNKEGNCNTVTSGALLGGGTSDDWMKKLDPRGLNPGLGVPLPEMLPPRPVLP